MQSSFMHARAGSSPRPLCRRLFLKAAGVSVGLPFLPSLATTRAFAADPVFPQEKYFFGMVTGHGACFDSNFFPDLGTLNQQMTYAGTGHTVRWGNLVGKASGSDVTASPVLTAPGSKLTPKLLAKLNVLYGLDVAAHIGHNRGATFGNFADTNGLNKLGFTDRPTIDQIMAWSPSFYPNLNGIRERGMIYGPSWGYSNGATQSGVVQKIDTGLGSLDLFNRIFAATGQAAATPSRKPIVDRVLENYKRLRDGNKRLSHEDKQRLDDHMARLAEVQRRLTVTNTKACPNVTKPAEDANKYGDGNSYKDVRRYAQLYNDVFAVAFACGSSRIALGNGMSFENDPRYAGSVGDWHQDVAHQYQKPDSQGHLTQYYRDVFASIFLDLASKLDNLPSTPGRTILDDALLMWTQESGMDTHFPISLPVVTAGGAGGAIKTGLFVDYRNRESPNFNRLDASLSARDRTQYHGLLYNQFLATVLQAMNVKRPEFERWGHKGYGHVGFGTVAAEYPSSATMKYYESASSKYFAVASDPLPVIAA